MSSAHAPRAVPVWNFGDRARKIRRDILDVDQQEFARLLGVTAQAASAWESRGAQPRNPVPIARRIEALTGVPASWVLGLDEPAEPVTERVEVPQRVATRSRRAPNAEKWS